MWANLSCGIYLGNLGIACKLFDTGNLFLKPQRLIVRLLPLLRKFGTFLKHFVAKMVTALINSCICLEDCSR